MSSKATNTGYNGKSEDINRLRQMEDYIEMKFKEAARNFDCICLSMGKSLGRHYCG
jgi:hypothetical protein